jgi:phasin family protein
MNEIPDMVFEPIKPLVASVARTNQMVLGQVEKWMALQADSLKAYMDLGLSQVKVALKVTDLHSLQEFSGSQFAVMNFMSHRVLDDVQAIREWGADCFVQTHRLSRENTLRWLFKW